MRISFVLSSLHLSGGVRVVVEYANRLARRGYGIYLIAPKNSVDLSVMPQLDEGVAIIESSVALKKPSSLPDNLALSISLSRAVPPCDLVVSTHTPTTVPAWLAARLWRRTRLFWLYMDYREMFAGRPIELFLLKHAAPRHDKILTISEFCRQENLAMSGVEATVVGLGLSQADIFHPLPRASYDPADPKTILYLGDDRPRKGLADFLAACEQLYPQETASRIIIISKNQLELTTKVPITVCLRPGAAELARLYATCDVFVFTSWREGFGLPPLEAMACGAPVVLTDSGGVREFARDGENCLLVSPRAIHAIAQAIQRVLTDPALAERLRQNGPPTAAKFDWEQAVDRFETAFFTETKKQ